MRKRYLLTGVTLVFPLLFAGCAGSSGGSATSVSSSMSSGHFGAAEIQIESALMNTLLQSPLVIKGQAKGSWFFEGSFPVTLRDSEGNRIATAPARAKGDWMTQDFVPFEASFSFTTASQTGTIMFEKDNPSGLPAHAGSLTVPVRFR